MQVWLSIWCFFALFLSTILNVLLLVASHKTRMSARGYGRMIVAFAILDLIFSSAQALYAVMYIATPGLIGLAAASVFSEVSVLMAISINVWCVVFPSTLCAITYNYLYRFMLLCSPDLLPRLNSFAGYIASASILMVFIAIVLYAVHTCFKASPIPDAMYELIVQEYGDTFISNKDYMIVLHLDSIPQKGLAIGLMVGIIAFFVFLFSFIVFFAFRIHRAIATQTLSKRSQVMHSRALKMMSVQALVPLVTLYFPMLINAPVLLAGIHIIKQFAWISSLLFSLFPILNAFVIIYWTDELRKFVLVVLQFRRPRSANIISSISQIRFT